MLNRANVGAGDSVLITGASGGVGSRYAISQRRGATTIAMASAAKQTALQEAVYRMSFWTARQKI